MRVRQRPQFFQKAARPGERLGRLYDVFDIKSEMEKTSLGKRECLRTDVLEKTGEIKGFWLVKKTHLGGETGGGGSGKGAAGGRQGLDRP